MGPHVPHFFLTGLCPINLAESRPFVRERTDIKFCDHKRKILPSGWAHSLFWHDQLGMGCSGVEKRMQMVFAAGSTAQLSPPQLLCMFFPNPPPHPRPAPCRPISGPWQCSEEICLCQDTADHGHPCSDPLPPAALAPRWGDTHGSLVQWKLCQYWVLWWHLYSARTIMKAPCRLTVLSARKTVDMI